MSSSIKVAVRVRPFNLREKDMHAQCIVEMDGKKTRILKPKQQSVRDAGRESHHDFTFDYSYWSFNENSSQFATQEQVYNDLGTDVVECAFQGYNACVFAYGQTGSGKTFTMMGTPDNPGLIPKICQEMFARMRVGQESGTGYKTQASYLEIYNERVKDLLGAHSVGHGLRVREHRSLGPYVENLSQHSVANFDEIQECITRGNIQRTTASTNMNDTSSRSHAIFTITFVQAVFMNDMPSETVAKIHLVDLAGSERANATGATGQRLKEGAHINKSLVTLGSVISALAEQTNFSNSNQNNSGNVTSKRVLYIPYRDSILTWLLKDSLGGNSKTIMIAALSPADCNYSETLSTLRYANRAKNIINKPTINEDANVKLIRELREEIAKLKSMLKGDVRAFQPSSKMLEDLHKKEAQEKVLTEEWTEKWKEAQLILQEQKSLGLRKSGVGVVLDSEMPHLIGIHNDITTGVTLYSLKEGETFIGSECTGTPPDIALNGDGILQQHCSIVLRDGICTLYPRPMAQCWLNAHLIEEPVTISQGDIILLGRTNIFRFNNPAEAAKMRRECSRSQLDMSRLSLITSSRENLLSSSFYAEEDNMNNCIVSPLKPYEKQYHPTKPVTRDDPEMQDENRKILETIENALKQLNIERVQMHEQYKIKVQKLSNDLKHLEHEEKENSFDYLRCKENELIARKDMLLWEKNNEKVQIDILCRQISALQMQLDSKKRDFSEYVAKELQELQDCGKLEEIGVKIDDPTNRIDDILVQAAESLDSYASQFIKDTVKKMNEEIHCLEKYVVEKEHLLNASTKKIVQLDDSLLQIKAELNNLRIIHEQSESQKLGLKKESLKLSVNSSSSFPVTSTPSSSYSTSDDVDDNEDLLSHPLNNKNNAHNIADLNLICSNVLMSDSGVCLDQVKSSHNNENDFITQVAMVDDQNEQDAASCSSCEINQNTNKMTRVHCPMQSLRRKIAAHKALIMKNLEVDVDKMQLDIQIAELQELQRQCVRMEKKMLDSESTTSNHEFCCNEQETSDVNINYISNEALCYEEEPNRVGNTGNLRCERDFCKNFIALNGFTKRLIFFQVTANADHLITIPTFVMRGAGKQTHYEYEVRIIVPDGKLSILRRYSRFRELHMSMKNSYGTKIAALPFPRRELFSSSSETVAKHRRRLLELYLRRLIAVCTRIPQSPIYEGTGGPGLTRTTLSQLSPFFKKGIFENGKHGTG
uniref:Kinesin motor domain-containing protein n=1 Tax=Glossina brevipalpis TaxID=37001 RepID=A0A1A9WYT0_9MUSC